MLSLFVNIPKGDELKHSMDVYTRLGLPGCVGSIDGTKIGWDKCPSDMSNICSGKEKYPALGFQVIVNHMRKIFHVSRYFYGSATDISMAYWDPVTRCFLEGNLGALSKELEENVFKTVDLNLLVTNWKGCYLITDQGYLKRSIFVDTSTYSYAKNHVMWGEWLESVRKDVECTIGILKSRFRFLKNAVKFHSPDTIEHAMRTCAAVHNILLKYDELDVLNWESIDPDAAETVCDAGENYINSEYASDLFYGYSQHDDEDQTLCISVHDTGYDVFKKVLVNHFTQQYFEKRLFWPRAFTGKQKELFALNTDVLSRVHGATLQRFSVADSSVTRNGYSMGKGLFATGDIPKGSLILYFEGRIRTFDEMATLPNGGKPNCFYTIQLEPKRKNEVCGDDPYLDCYQHYKGGLCLASYANSPSGCEYKDDGKKATSNAKLIVTKTTAKLIAMKKICKFEEILWFYGRDYKFPEEC